MQAVAKREVLLERRAHNNVSDDSLWDMLSLAQKFAASSLMKFGYKLGYMRYSNDGSLVIMQCNDSLATIAEDGEIDSSPQIKIRF